MTEREREGWNKGGKESEREEGKERGRERERRGEEERMRGKGERKGGREGGSNLLQASIITEVLPPPLMPQTFPLPTHHLVPVLHRTARTSLSKNTHNLRRKPTATQSKLQQLRLSTAARDTLPHPASCDRSLGSAFTALVSWALALFWIRSAAQNIQRREREHKQKHTRQYTRSDTPDYS